MKKVFIVPLLLLSAVKLGAQQQATFKMAFLPQTNYTITKDMKMTLDVDSSAAAGAQGQMTMAMTTKILSEITTGMPDNKQTFPLKMVSKATDIKIIVNGQDLPGGASAAPPAISLYGKYLASGKFMIDSASFMIMSDSIKMAMTRLLDAATNNLSFPDHPLRIGDSFSQDIPLTLPAIPISPTSGITMKITYTLTRITGNIASFDFKENINPDPKHDTSTKAIPINMTGKGGGNLDFDIKKHFFSTVTNSLTLDYEMITGSSTLKFRGTFISTDKAEAGR